MANPVNLRAIIGVIDKATAPMRGIARGFAGMGLQAKLAQANIARIARQTGFTAMLAQMGRVGHAGMEVARSLGEIARKAAEIAGIGALGGIAGIGEMLRSFAERGDAAAKVAARLGMTVKEYQEYSHAAKEADIEQESFDKGLRKLTMGIGAVAGGKNPELAALFRHMGISARDAKGNLKSTADILPQVAAAFERNKNPTLRMAMAVALFGEKNTQMIDLLAQGPAALARYREEAQKFGVAMGPDQVKAAEALDDGYKHVTMSLTGLSNAIGGKLGPALAPLLESFADWIAANREIISARLGEAVTGITNALKNFDWRGFGQSLLSIGRGIDKVVGWMGGWRNAAIAVAVILNAELIVSVFALGKALTLLSGSLIRVGFNLGALAFGAVAGAAMNFVTAIRAGYGAMAALNLVMSANPIGLIIIGIAALIAAGVLLWKNWDTVKAAWDALTGWISGKAKWLLDALSPLLTALKFITGWKSPPVPSAPAAGGGATMVPGPRGPVPLSEAASFRPPGGRQGLLSSSTMLAANAGGASKAPAPQRSDVAVSVDFKNLPQGVPVKVDASPGVKKSVNVGHAMQPAR